MARVKNTTLVGQGSVDVDSDTPTFQRAPEDAQGNYALIHDKVTGENGETEVIDHSGVLGRGALLGIPWINQTFSGRDDRYGRWGALLGYTDALVGAKGNGSFGSDTIVCGQPVYVPPGELSFKAYAFGPGLGTYQWRLLVVDAADYATVYVNASMRVGPGGVMLSLDVPAAPAAFAGGWRVFLLIADTTQRQITDGTSPDSQVKITSWLCGPMRQRAAGTAQQRLLRSALDFYVPPPGSGALSFRDFDESLFTDALIADGRLPISGYHLAGINANRHALLEYITGFPVGGNSAYTHSDSATTNPSTSRFMAHTRSVFGDEPLLTWPCFSEAFGAGMTDGYFVTDTPGPPSLGMLDWYAYDPRDITLQIHRTWRMRLPDFDTTDVQLQARVLAISRNSTEAVKWSTVWNITGDTVNDSFAAMTGNANMFLAARSNVGWTPDNINTISLKLEKSAAKVDDDIRILGAAMAFVPV